MIRIQVKEKKLWGSRAFEIIKAEKFDNNGHIVPNTTIISDIAKLTGKSNYWASDLSVLNRLGIEVVLYQENLDFL